MKKILRKILAVSASLLLLSSFVSCGEGEDDDDKSGPVVPGGSTGGGGNGGTSGADLWKDAEMLDELANTNTEGENGWGAINISTDIAQRLQVGSKVIFEIAEYNSYSKFRVTKGWGKVGNGKIGDPSSSTPYYKIDGTKLNAKECLDAGNSDNNHPGTWENEPGEPGAYYFVVDEANLSALKTGFDIVGCFKCVKIGITNLAAKPAEDPIPEGTVKTIKLEKNVYAENPESQVKVVLDFNKVKVGDKVTLKMKGKASKAFKGEFFIVDTTEDASWWGELAAKYPADETEGVKNPLDVPVDFDIEHEFEINHAQWGSGNTACMLAINAVDGDDTVKMYCTEYSVTLTKGEGWNSQEEEPETPPASTVPTALSGITIPEGATVLYKASDAANSVFKDAEIQTWWDNKGALAFKIEYTKIGDTEGVVKVTSEAGSCGAFALGEGKTVSIPAGQKLVISVYTANGVIFKPVAPDKEFSVTGKADWQLFEVSYTEAAELKQLGIVGNGKSGNSEHYIDAVYLVEDDNAGGNTGSDPVAPPAATADYSAKNLDVTTVTNTYSESHHGIQAKMTVRTGDNLKGLAAGDKFTVVMKGTSTKAFVPQVYFMDNTAAGAYTNLGEWGDTINITTDAFEVTKEITLKKAPSSDDADAFMFVIDYDEKGASADIENATITFSEFKITKKVSE